MFDRNRCFTREERDAGAAPACRLPVGDAGFRRTGAMAGRSLARLAGHVLADGGIADPLHIATLLAPEPTDTIPSPKSLEQAVVAPLRDFLAVITPG